MNEPIDFTPLDPERDPSWRGRMLESVMTRVADASRSPAPGGRSLGFVVEITEFARPVLIAASLLVTVALFTQYRRMQPNVPAERRFAVAEALGLSTEVARWVESGQYPSANELLITAGGY